MQASCRCFPKVSMQNAILSDMEQTYTLVIHVTLWITNGKVVYSMCVDS